MYTCKILSLILFIFLYCCSNILVTTSLDNSVLRTADCKCKSWRFKSLKNFSSDSLMFACTVLCFPFGYKQWPVAEWSKLSFTFSELLAHSVGCRFESCQWLLFFHLYSVSTYKKFSHPLYLSSCMRSCHTMVKSAVLPKTTNLCTSITVITLWKKIVKIS